METENRVCPFCGSKATAWEDRSTLKNIYRGCLCDEFIISRDVLDNLKGNKILETDEAKKLFSGYLRNNKPITITNEFINDKLQEILDYCQSISLDEKIYKIKNYIYQETTFLEEPIKINFENIYTLFYLKKSEELARIIRYLNETKTMHLHDDISVKPCRVALTIEGFSKIEASFKEHSQSKKVFIACKFGTNYQDKLVETIKSACTACGFEANLVSDKMDNENISNKIISDIKKAKFIIADFTGQNNGVYFEAGYGMGMKKEVIRLIRKGNIKKLHFDTKQFTHIEWEENKWSELKSKLINQIDATIK